MTGVIPLFGQDLVVNQDLTLGTDADPNGQDWDYTDGEILIGDGLDAVGSLTVPANELLLYGILRLGTGDATASGALTVTGADALVELGVDTLTSSDSELQIGVEGSGNLSITDGGVVRRTNFRLGLEPTGSGVVTVSGSTSLLTSISTWGLRVGVLGSGSVILQDGAVADGVSFISLGEENDGVDNLGINNAGSGSLLMTEGSSLTGSSWLRIGDAAGSTGTATISGAGTFISMSSFCHVGSGGDGTLTVDDGATAQFGNVSVSANDRVNENGTGAATISGADTTLDVDGFLWVGRSGSGTMDITNGASVTVSNEVRAGRTSEGDGVITVSGPGSSLSADSFSYIGSDGIGTVNVSDGGSYFTGTHFRLGMEEGAEGYSQLTGQDSSIESGSYTYIGNRGYGELEILDGATFTTGSSFRIGKEASGSGIVTMSGNGSAINTGNLVYVGEDGDGELNMSQGATLTTTNGTIRLGVSSDSTGTLIMSDPGTRAFSDTFIFLGQQGNSSTEVLNGAELETSGNLTIANNSGGFSDLLISGTGSLAKSGESFRIGRFGTAELIAEDGARIEVGAPGEENAWDLSIAEPSNRIASAILTDAGTEAEVFGTINVAIGGTGTLDIANGATASATEDIRIALEAGADGTLTVTDAGSNLSTDANFLIGAELDDFEENYQATGGVALASLSNDASVSVAGDLVIRGTSTLSINQATVAVAGLLDAGDLDSTLAFTLDQPGNSGLSAEGIILDGANLEIELLANPEPGDSFVLIENTSTTPVTGTFSFDGSPVAEGGQISVTSGSFSGAFSVSYAAGPNNASVVLTAGSSSSPYGNWIAGFPGIDPTQTGPTDNPASDGIINAVKFVLGLDPTINESANIPTPIVDNSGPEELLIFDLTINPDAFGIPGIGITAESSSSLQSDDWQEVDPGLVTMQPAPNTDPNAIRVAIPVSEVDALFLRLRIDGIDNF